MRAIPGILLVAGLMGCATSYQPKGFTGGYEDLKVAEATYRIRVEGNGYTTASTVADILLLRAAELARRDGFSHFVVLSSNTAIASASFTTPGTYRATTSGGVTQGTITPGQTFQVARPTSEAIVRLQNGAQGAAMAFDAEAIYSSLAPRLLK